MRSRGLFLLALAVLLLGAFLWLDRDAPGSEEREERSRHVLPGFDPEAVLALEIEPADGEAVRLERQEAGPPEPRPRGPAAGEEDPAADAAPGEHPPRPRAALEVEAGDAGVDGPGGGRPAGAGTAIDQMAPGEAAGSVWYLTRPPRLAGTRADVFRVDSLLSALGRLVHEREMEDVAGDDAALAEVGLVEPRLRLHLDRIGVPDVDLLFGADVPASRQLILAVHPADGPPRVHVVDRAILQDLQHPPESWQAADP